MESRVVDMHVPDDSREACGALLVYYSSIKGPYGTNKYIAHLQSLDSNSMYTVLTSVYVIGVTPVYRG